MVNECRRRELSPEIVLAIQEAVTKAFKDNAHRCLVGFSEDDRHGLTSLKSLVQDYPIDNLRESFRIMKTVIKIRNLAGNIFVCVFFGGLFMWALNKLIPGVTWK